MNVVFSVSGQVIVDDKGHLLDINTTSQQVSGDKNTRGSGSEFSHDDVTFLLVHVAVLQEGKGKLAFQSHYNISKH